MTSSAVDNGTSRRWGNYDCETRDLRVQNFLPKSIIQKFLIKLFDDYICLLYNYEEELDLNPIEEYGEQK